MPLALMPAGRATGPRSAVERSRSARPVMGNGSWFAHDRARSGQRVKDCPQGSTPRRCLPGRFQSGRGDSNPRPPAPKAGNELLLRTSISMSTWTFGAGPSRSVTPCANSLWHVFGTGLSRRPSEQGPRGTSAFGTSVESHHVDAPIHTRSYSRSVRIPREISISRWLPPQLCRDHAHSVPIRRRHGQFREPRRIAGDR